MIRIVFLMSVLIFTTKGTSQEWFPLGASWYYNQIILLQGETYSYFEVTDELIINGRTCKIISGSCNCTMPGIGGYLYQEGDIIYFYNPGAADSLKILYDFTLVAGDTLTITGDSLLGGDGKFLIDSVTHMQFGSENLRVQHLTSLNYNIGWGNKIIERIGANGCLYPQVNFCDPSTGGLRCYEDDEVGLLNFQVPPRPCTYTTAVADHAVLPLITVYPNPASGNFYIRSESQIEKVTLYDYLSVPVYHESSVFHTDIEVNTSSIPAGLYSMKIVLSNYQNIYKTVVIQK